MTADGFGPNGASVPVREIDEEREVVTAFCGPFYLQSMSIVNRLIFFVFTFGDDCC